ncbi:MAG: response regulator [Nannocystaceae bacterium]|nr:response regulator [Myxococcales bacterium]
MKILVADDSASQRTHARAILQGAGYTVVLAQDGREALELFRKEAPDLVILDVVMPHITGLEACRVLKKGATTYLPVLMVSGRNTVQDRVDGLRNGADDFLGKPYDPTELCARIEVLLRIRAFTSQAGPAEQRPPDEPARRASDGVRAPRDFSVGESVHAPMSDEAFLSRMHRTFEAAESHNDPLALVLIEIDPPGAGAVNRVDLAVQTELLRAVIARCIRKIDLVNPRGEGGFVLLLPETHFPGALTVAERVIREARRELAGVAVSIGVSFYPNRDTRTLVDMIGLGEAALSRARDEGGGKICLFQHQAYLYAPD